MGDLVAYCGGRLNCIPYRPEKLLTLSYLPRNRQENIQSLFLRNENASTQSIINWLAKVQLSTHSTDAGKTTRVWGNTVIISPSVLPCVFKATTSTGNSMAVAPMMQQANGSHFARLAQQTGTDAPVAGLQATTATAAVVQPVKMGVVTHPRLEVL